LLALRPPRRSFRPPVALANSRLTGGYPLCSAPPGLMRHRTVHRNPACPRDPS
jgi:hypothetical protein